MTYEQRLRQEVKELGTKMEKAKNFHTFKIGRLLRKRIKRYINGQFNNKQTQ